METNNNHTAALITKQSWTKTGQETRLQFLEQQQAISLPFLGNKQSFADLPSLKGNIEHYIGMTQVPTGIIGEVRIQGADAEGDFFVPLATSEGALVASYHRGTVACKMAGAITAVVVSEQVQRCPIFRFSSLSAGLHFVTWVEAIWANCQQIVSQQSRYAKLQAPHFNIEGNQVIIIFEYKTGDAAGQNMVTVCTEAVCQYLVAHSPSEIKEWFIDGNLSGDKKVRGSAFMNPRGKYVTAEIVLPRPVVTDFLRTTPEKMQTFWQNSALGAFKMGAIGMNAHFPNGLAALFLACGQDVACISEACVGISRAEVTPEGDLYGAVTLPNLIVGTVGGGTHLPTQQECLKIMGCYGEGKSRKFAAICAAVLLAGEFSISAAMAGGYFSKAHKLYGRRKETSTMN
jgi:hydroxymethylglutaryl-CoA reductase (NADPH)